MVSRRPVILISDDEQLARTVRWLLTEDGYTVTHCPSAEDALRSARLIEAPVIVFDGPMGADKRQATDLLRAAFDDARIIGLHVHGDGIEAHINAEGHLHKPFHADDLLGCIADVVAQPARSASKHVHAR